MNKTMENTRLSKHFTLEEFINVGKYEHKRDGSVCVHEEYL